jgi:hypothetical protein
MAAQLVASRVVLSSTELVSYYRLKFIPGGLILHRTCQFFVRFEVFTAVTMKNAVFWDVTPCGSGKNLHLGGAKFLRNVRSYKSHTA